MEADRAPMLCVLEYFGCQGAGCRPCDCGRYNIIVVGSDRGGLAGGFAIGEYIQLY